MKSRLFFYFLLLGLVSFPLLSKADNIPNAQTYSSGIPYRGVSLSGGEFVDTAEHLASSGKFFAGINDAALFLYRGMNVYRVQITWEYLADINGNFKTDANAQAYLAALDKTINILLAKKAFVLLDLHNY